MFDIDSLLLLAYKYGPFFFAVWFNGFITQRASRIYNNATTPGHIKTYKWHFIATTTFGALLVVAAITWWMKNPTNVYVFEGEIKSLNEYEKVTSDSLFFKPNLLEKLDEEAPQIRHMGFVALKNRPFKENDQFDIYFRKGSGTREEMSINYTKELKSKFKIEWDSSLGKNIIKNSSAKLAAFSLLSSNAYAETIPSVISEERKIKLDKPAISLTRGSMKMVPILQQERTDIGTKIAALDKLNSLKKEEIDDFINYSTPKEPFALTLLDLTRHSDPELSFKATKLTRKFFNMNSYAIQGLMSDESDYRENTVKVLYRIELQRAQSIMKALPDEFNEPWIKNIKKDMKSGLKSKVLVPTGSAQGDRYYVQATWGKGQKDVIDCLTKLFNSSLISNRTLKEEESLMKKRVKRWVYWYSKDWSLDMYDQINKCGGKASFVSGQSKK